MDLNELASSAGPPIVFMLAIWFLTLSVRRVVEKLLLKSLKEHMYWKDIVLPILPIVLGAAFATVMFKFPFLDKLPSAGTRAFYGCVGGGGSGVLYKVIKALVKKKYGVELSLPPGAMAGSVTIEIPKDQLPKVDVHYPGKSENEETDPVDSDKPVDSSVPTNPAPPEDPKA